MIINISWGVGLGLILNKKLFRGYEGFAEEFSHITPFFNKKYVPVEKGLPGNRKFTAINSRKDPGRNKCMQINQLKQLPM